MSRRLVMGVIVFCGTLLALLVLLEVALRIVGYSSPRIVERDDNRGTARVPGAQFLYTSEGRGHVRINTAGFRDEEWRLQKPRHTVRIAILGDSYVEALQVEENERFAEVAERMLNASHAAGERNVEVMSFGVSGYGTAQELQTLRHHVWQYEPDLVVLALLPANDIRNNSKALEQDAGRPYFHYQNGVLSLDDSFRRAPEHRPSVVYRLAMRLVDYSRLAAFSLNSVRSQLGRRSRQRQLELVNAAGRPEDEAGLDVWVYAEPRDQVQEDAWRITEGIIQLMHREVRSRGSSFLLVILTSGRQVDPDARVRDEFMRRLGVKDLYYPEHRMGAFAQREGIALLSLAQPFLQSAQHSGVPLHGFDSTKSLGHWNAAGHREAGRLLAGKVSEMWKMDAAAFGRPSHQQ